MKIGERFLFKNEYSIHGNSIYDEYILCLVDCPRVLVNLIELSEGTPWSSPVAVKQPDNITEDEMRELMKGSFDEFIHIRRQ